jgi:hypothetical protein
MNNDFLPPRGQNTNRAPRPSHRSSDWQRPVAFRTPEEAATEETPSEQIVTGGGTPDPHTKKSLKQRIKELTKKQWAIIIVVGVLLLGGIGYGIYHFFIKDAPKPVKQTVKKETPPPPAVPITSTLTGLTIPDASINKRPVTAVMIENSLDARPQAGIGQAGVVFEAIAEGGITRFLTLFQDSEPDYIGPVRSVRPYYVQWLAGFDAAVAHVGGSADALAMLKRGEAKDLDQFANPGPYHRVSNRFAPHNMYSSVVALRELQTKKGFTSTYSGFLRKSEAKSAAPTASSIDFNISSAVYNPHYDYDAATNTYKRSEGGKPHLDEKSGQIAPKVVVALTMAQGSNGIYTTYGNLGSGQAHIFQDGVVTIGTWTKTGAKDQIVFKDASGAPIKLNPGQTWISVVGNSNRISYK